MLVASLKGVAMQWIVLPFRKKTHDKGGRTKKLTASEKFSFRFQPMKASYDEKLLKGERIRLVP